MRISINGSTNMALASVEGALADIEASKNEGFTGYWLAQIGLVDALTVFAAAGDRTADLEIGTAVIATFPRHPSALAAQALTTQAVCPGQLVLGIGLSHEPAVRDSYKLHWDRPIRHLRDYLDVLLPLLEEGRVDHDGEIWGGAMESGRPTTRVPSVMVAALGPQALDVTGRRTDGTILWLVGPKTIREHIAPRINEAAAAAGRPQPRVVASLPVCVTDDPDGARAVIGQILDGYQDLPSYKAMLDREGAAGPADVSIVGDEAHVAAALDELADAGATEFAAVPLDLDPEAGPRTRACLTAWMG